MRTTWLLCVQLLLFSSKARAEIQIEKSVEWLCARAHTVAHGTITRIKDHSGPGKSRDLIGMTFKVNATLKGDARQRMLYFSVRHPEVKAFHKHLNRTELLVFLDKTPQGYASGGHAYHLWPLRNSAGKQLLVDLAAPGKALLSATDFKVLKTRKTILAACRRALKRLGKRGGAAQGRAARRRLLEVPVNTAVHRALWSGSACYLVVPGRLFPQARERLGGGRSKLADAAAAAAKAKSAERAKSPAVEATSGGTLCVEKLSIGPNTPHGKGAVTHERYMMKRGIFHVQVDSRPRQKVWKRAAGIFRGLSLDDKHMLRIRYGRRTIKWIRFDFRKEKSDYICIRYDPFYSTWRVLPRGSKGRCGRGCN